MSLQSEYKTYINKDRTGYTVIKLWVCAPSKQYPQGFRAETLGWREKYEDAKKLIAK